MEHHQQKEEDDQANTEQINSLQQRLVGNEQAEAEAEESKQETTLRKNKNDDESWVLEGYNDNDEKVSFEDIEDLHEDILDERKVEETEDDERESAQASYCCFCWRWRAKKPQPPQNEWLKHFRLLVKNSRFIKNSWSGGLFALINNRFSAYSSTESEQKELHMNACTQVELIKQQRLSDEQENNNNQPEKNIKKILANSVIMEEEVDSLRHSQISCENTEEREVLKKIILNSERRLASKSNNNNNCSNYFNNIANYEDYVINSSKEANNEQQDTDAVDAATAAAAAPLVEDSSRIIKYSAESSSRIANTDQSTQNGCFGTNEFRNSITQQQTKYIAQSIEGKRQLSNDQLPSARNGSNPQSGSTSRKISQMSGERGQQSYDNFNESALSNGSDNQRQISKISARKKVGRSVEVVSKPMHLRNNFKPNKSGLKPNIMKKNNSILADNNNEITGMRCNTLLEESESLKVKDWELYEAAVYYKSITCVIEEHLKELNNFEIEKPLRVIRDNFLEFYINQYGGQLQRLSKTQVAASVRDLKEFVTLFLEVIREYYALDALAANFRNAECFLTTDNLVNFICSILFQDDLLYSIVYAAHTHFDKTIQLQFFQSSKELEPYLHLSQLGVKEYYCLDETTLLKLLHSQGQQGNPNPEESDNNNNTFQQSDIAAQADQSFFSSTSSQTIYKKSMKAAQKELEEKYRISANQLKPFHCPYQKAIDHLKTIAFHRSPVHKLKVIIKTQELINQCIKDFYEHFSLDLQSISYDADNLLAILSYILIKSKVYDIISHLKIIENFATKNTLNGSAGYLVVTLSCCIKFINSIDIPSLLERNQLIIINNKKK